MQLKNYQNTAIKNFSLKQGIAGAKWREESYFKAPTGSGKTIMTAEF